jgi:hypothetical protein
MDRIAAAPQSTTPTLSLLARSPRLPLDLEERPAHDADQVLVAIYPQDPLVDKGKPIIVPFPRKDMVSDGTRLTNDLFATENQRTPRDIAPDEHGDYIFAPGTPEFGQVNAHVHATQVVHMIDAYRGTPVPWDFGDPRRSLVTIHVNHDRSGDSHTSFGHRDINLDTYMAPVLGKEVRDCECADAIAHEVGHDILASFRPDAGTSVESGAFHEAFGDITAILYALQFEQNRGRALRQTHGNLHRQNLIAMLFEEDGKATRLRDHPEAHGGFYIRSAVNRTKYDAGKIEDMDPHDASLPYTAAFYDALVAVYERERAAGKPEDEALVSARDQMATLWTRSFDFLPQHDLTFESGARALLQADHDSNAGLGDVLRHAFVARHILPS